MTTHDRDKIIAAAKEAGTYIDDDIDGNPTIEVIPESCWEKFYAIAFEDGAARYNELRRGQHWSVLDGIGNVIRGDDLDVAVDEAIRARGDMK